MAASNVIHYQLWMGSLEPYMTESLILSAFRKMGENPLGIKVMQDNLTGEPAGYCFVHFASDEEAMAVMHRLNGQLIPGASQGVRFCLNIATNTDRHLLDKEFPIWVSGLTPDVDDYILYRELSSTYNSIKVAKVIMDHNGISKGYALVKFGEEHEMKSALRQMNGFHRLGSGVVKVCCAVPKLKSATMNPSFDLTSCSTDYYVNSYWQNYAAWSSEYYGQAEAAQAAQVDQAAQIVEDCQSAIVNRQMEQYCAPASPENDDNELVEHTVPIDVDKLNEEVMQRDANLWDALESSKWFPYEDLETDA